MFGKAAQASHGGSTTVTTSTITATNQSKHDISLQNRSVRKRAEYLGHIPKLPFNAENHEGVYIASVHVPRKPAEPQSARIGYMCSTNDGGEAVQAPIYGKRKAPKFTTDDHLVGGLLIPTTPQTSRGPTPRDHYYPGDSDESTTVTGLADAHWTGKKASHLAPLTQSTVGGGGGSEVSAGVDAAEIPFSSSGGGEGWPATSTSTKSRPTNRRPRNIEDDPVRRDSVGAALRTNVLPPIPEAPPTGRHRKWTADKWGHGGGGYPSRKSLYGDDLSLVPLSARHRIGAAQRKSQIF